MTDRNEINSLSYSSTHPLPPLEQCNGEKMFSLFSAGREYSVLEGRMLIMVSHCMMAVSFL